MILDELNFYKQEYYKLLDFLPVAVAVAQKSGEMDNSGLPFFTVHYLNQRFRQVLGYSLQDIPDSNIWDQVAFPDHNYRRQVQDRLREEVNKHSNQVRDIVKINCKNGETNWFEMVVENFNTSPSKFFYYVFTEINNFKEQINRLENISSLDPLTNLFNRRGILDALDNQVFSVPMINQNLCLALVDLDNFKQINDRLGHPGGDYVLQQFSQYLKKTIRQSDLLARWGGEEFLIIFINTDIETAHRILQRIQYDLKNKEMVWQNQRLNLTFTCGVAESGNQINLAKLIEQADQAMYQGKETGRNRIILYQSESIN